VAELVGVVAKVIGSRSVGIDLVSDLDLRRFLSLVLLTSCTSLNILVVSIDLRYPQGAPLQVNCVEVPLVGILRSTFY
jgi:hypothetical protein